MKALSHQKNVLLVLIRKPFLNYLAKTTKNVNKKHTKFELSIHIFLFVFSLILFVFSLISGAKPSAEGIIENLPNTAPWIIMLVLNFIAYKYKLVGGILLTTYVIALVLLLIFLNKTNHIFFLLLILSPFFLAGVLFTVQGIGLRCCSNKRTTP